MRERISWIGGTIAVAYLITSYAKHKWQMLLANRSKLLNGRQNLKFRFDLNVKDCLFVVQSLLPGLKECLYEAVNVEVLSAQLRQKQNSTILEESKREKKEMWSSLKTKSFTRTITAVYLVNLVAFFTTVQLSLLGRFVYLDSVSLLDSDNDEVSIKTISADIERQYLTLSWYILNIGWKDCLARVETSVEKVVGGLSLSYGVSHSTIVDILHSIRAEVELKEDGTAFKFESFLLPLEGQEDTVLSQGGIGERIVDEQLQSLVDETRDFLECDDFSKVLSYTLDESFEVLTEQFRSAFFDQLVVRQASGISFEAGDDGSPTSLEEPVSKTFALAGILPLISRTSQQVITGTPNTFLDRILNSPQLLAFSSVIYGGWE